MRRPAQLLCAAIPVLLAAGLDGACGGDSAPAGGAPATPEGSPGGSLADLLAAYEEGRVSRTDFAAGLAGFDTSPAAADLRGTLAGVVLLRARPTAYAVPSAMQIPPGAALVVEGGATVVIAAGVTVDVKGRLYAMGTRQRPVTIAGAGRDGPYKTLLLGGGRSELVGVVMGFGEVLVSVRQTGKTPILIEDGKLDNWRTHAVDVVDADGAVVRGNDFGLETRLEDARSETIHGSQSAVLIERNVFGRRAGYNDHVDLQPCTDGHHPVMVGNRFLGGDDDGIDLDDCTALVVGNHFKDFRPGPTAAGQANGGGITGQGARSQSLIVNNIVETSVHAVGFKDGARPTFINNTFIDCDIGLTLYSADGRAEAATAVLIGNVFWSNKTDVLLDGSWFPAYSPSKKGAVEASHNAVTDAALTGQDENRGEDPLIQRREGLPHLGAGSPARGTGHGDLAALAAKTVFPVETLRRALETDYLGNRRPFVDGRFVGIDRGALQSQ